MEIKAGLGFDLHRLKKGRKLFLGGIEIEYSKGLLGHSDGDCLIHAIIDALLGAMGEGDIGQAFPETEPRYKDTRSTELLKQIVNKVKEASFEILNIDTVIMAQEPRLSPHVEKMKDVLCPILEIKREALGIKAKTMEGSGLIGRKKAMASLATTLLRKREG